MSGQWKPGTLAMVRLVGADAKPYRAFYSGYHGNWISAEGGVLNTTTYPPEVRPLVVIDPQDLKVPIALGQRIGRLVAQPGDDISHLIDTVQGFFREVALDEPTDPKTRVTDRRDNIWRLLADGDWVCTSGPDTGEYITWSRLAADRGPLTTEVPS